MTDGGGRTADGGWLIADFDFSFSGFSVSAFQSRRGGTRNSKRETRNAETSTRMAVDLYACLALFSTYVANVSASTEIIISDLVGKLVPVVRQGIPEVRALYVFGSAADGRLRGDSDIDLAVLAAGRVESEILFSLAQACSLLVGREVELVDLRAVPVVFQAQIVGRGRRLEVPCGNHEADFFENQVLSRYAAFVEERRPVVSEILKRRSIHAA